MSQRTSASRQLCFSHFRASPLTGKELYFAGEHTSEEHPATVVGAYLSGLTAARTVAKDWPQALSTPIGRPTPVGTK